MGAPCVEFDGVWKKFRRGERHDSLRDLIPSFFNGLGNRLLASELQEDEFWAVKDVSFEVQPGTALAIIGPNGAGKSTVLKLLTKILKPTRGSLTVRGRTGALIELAAGFHPDLTGRENIYLQGAVMGMKRAEIARTFDEIVEFAEVGEFVDTQIKRYSSGMQARLGFSIAAHLDPEVLLIDEVLSVGDMRFQERCFERMMRFKSAGVGIVFVSHNLSVVASLCDQALVLRRGGIEALAPVDEGIAAYAKMVQDQGPADSTGGGTEVIAELRDAQGLPTQRVNAGDEITLWARFLGADTRASLASGIRFRSLEKGELVYAALSTSLDCDPVSARSGQAIEMTWRLAANLTRGHYSVELFVFDAVTLNVLCRLHPAATFAVTETASQSGLAHLNARCSAVAVQPNLSVPLTDGLHASGSPSPRRD